MTHRYLDYLNIRFAHLGRGWEQGDCFNLVLRFYQRELGIDLPDKTDYPEDWQQYDYFTTLYQQWGFVPVTQPGFGDVVLIRGQYCDWVSHCGVVLDGEYFLHTSQAGTAINRYLTGAWAGTIQGFYHYKGDTDAD